MPSQGPTAPVTWTDDNAVGTRTWTNPGNAALDDAVYATISFTANAQISHYLKGLNPGWTVPVGSTIEGHRVTIEKACLTAVTENSIIQDSTVKLVIAGAVTGNNLADPANWPVSDATTIYGGPTETWGTTPTVAQVNAADFGMVLSAKSVTADVYPDTGQVDIIKMVIYYTPPSVATRYLLPLMGAGSILLGLAVRLSKSFPRAARIMEVIGCRCRGIKSQTRVWKYRNGRFDRFDPGQASYQPS